MVTGRDPPICVGCDEQEFDCSLSNPNPLLLLYPDRIPIEVIRQHMTSENAWKEADWEKLHAMMDHMKRMEDRFVRARQMVMEVRTIMLDITRASEAKLQLARLFVQELRRLIGLFHNYLAQLEGFIEHLHTFLDDPMLLDDDTE